MPISQFGRIYTIYRAEVVIPEDVFRTWGNTAEYKSASLAGWRAVDTSGQLAYAEVVEWGEAPTRRQCEDFISHWHNWILQHKEL